MYVIIVPSASTLEMFVTSVMLVKYLTRLIPLEDCDVFLMHALRPDRSSSTHFGLPKALEDVRKIKPKKTLFTDMMHLMDHDIVNEGLLKFKESEVNCKDRTSVI